MRKSVWRHRTNVQDLPEHPIEEHPAFRDYLAKTNYSANVRTGLRRILRTLPPCKLHELTPAQVDQALAQLIEDGYKPSSVNQYFRLLIAFLNYALETGKVSQNVATMAKGVNLQPEDPVPLAPIPDDVWNALDDYYRDPARATAEAQFFWASLQVGATLAEIAMATAGDITIKSFPEGGFLLRVHLGRTKRPVDYPEWIAPALCDILKAAQRNPKCPILYLDGHPVVFGKKTTLHIRALLARNQFYAIQRQLFGKPVVSPKAFRPDITERLLDTLVQINGLDSKTVRDHFEQLLAQSTEHSED